ncbi:MAG: hypothetical protein HQK65_07925 [Desulfamplus sp.]|nr:hypothetical protein [Desulfamplus sp.]
MEQETVEIYFTLEQQTEKAIKVTDGGNSFWLPKSQIKIKHVENAEDDVIVTMPEWLAIDKEIV